MPVEGNWERTHTPIRALGTRQVRILIAFLTALAIGVAALVYAIAAHRPQPLPAGCIEFPAANVIGGSFVRLCGDAAQGACREAAVKSAPMFVAARRSCGAAGIGAGG